MQSVFQTITQVIGAIGDDEFPVVAANALCCFSGFDLATIVIHRFDETPRLVFDNFDSVDCRQGIENYISFTHRLNPVLKCRNSLGAVRVRDYKAIPQPDERTGSYFQLSPEEELGFRTIGWPTRLEELGLYFVACGGVVEFSIYRKLTRSLASNTKLADLETLCGPIAEAFSRHDALSGMRIAGRFPEAALLSSREQQIADLLLIGCTSEAIALRLEISRHTVRDYRKQIFRKLQICSLAELFAVYHGQRNQIGAWNNTNAPRSTH
ncbi:LuxR C-terminal-related transcriptional regulator [Terriglobus saanensis]|uniref:Regulatory protein LuxR n=1 Tax=Terriglobus saanensis (strain ATCC BAA-1853 / DSM 23119 / SP1PR4) TaxID=401053 RepID=E8V3G9_TERSS|nr:LuxR C-terminal-related transcriptional regulator [Terriglobus saanensis]ADV83582.1 regulatory protein LuxR [Terriglobus saanensis SP1PR4]